MGTYRLTWYNLFRYQNTRSAILGQNDQNTPGQSRLTEGQNWSKPPQNSIFYVFTQNPRLSEIFVNFDQLWQSLTRGWLLEATRKSNFDMTVKIGSNNCHCKDYWIPFSTTIHGSKLELKWLRYLEKCVGHISLLLEAMTFDPTVGFLFFQVFWKLDIHSF